ncbi:MAG: methyltransferase domain-containing protein [Nitrospiraceae bacterium]|nr:MAG: methyltransferase domain-containing protein [Nitrospiraceae bacterium]
MKLHKQGVRRANKFSYSDPLKLHFGCGTIYKKGWINIDLFSNIADLSLDLRERLPFPDNSCSVIYSEHVLEHFDYPLEIDCLLEECRRVLKPTGLFSAAVPDTEWPIKACLNDDDNYFKLAKELWHPSWCRTKMEHINYHFRQKGEHLFAYDYETLYLRLKEKGFTKIIKRGFNPELDSEARKIGSLYIDCIKPG